jgi:hypothetical protein
MSGDFAPVLRRLERVENALGGQAMRAVLTADVGVPAKRDLHLEAVRTVGEDLRFSGWPRARQMTSGFDVVGDTSIELNPRPYGVWRVAEAGRKSTTAPRRGRATRTVILRTPYGPRTYSRERPLHIGATRGHRTLTVARQRIEAETPTRMFQGVQRELRKAWTS